MKVQLFLCLLAVGLCAGAGIPKSEDTTGTTSGRSVARRQHGVEWWSGPGIVLAAPFIAVTFIGLLWFAAYSTIHDSPSRVHPVYTPNAAVFQHVQHHTHQFEEPTVALSNQIASQVATMTTQTHAAPAVPVIPAAAVSEQITHRVLKSIEKHEKMQ